MRTSSRLWRVLALLMAFSLIATACGDDDGEDTAESTTSTAAGGEGNGEGEGEGDYECPDPDPSDDALTIGTLLPETGQLAFLGPPMVEAVRMAICDINAAGGALDGHVRLLTGDDGTDPDVANTTVDQLLSDGAHGIVGAAGSGITRQVVDKITGSNVVQCSPSNTALDLRNAGQNGFYFRTAPSDDLQGPALAEVVLGDGHSNVAILVRADEYGVGFGDAIEAALEDAGATVVYYEQYDPNATNWDAEVQAVAAADADAVVLIGFEEGIQIVQKMIEEGIGPADMPLYIADGMATGDLGELIDPSNPAIAAGVKGTEPSAAPESGAAFFPAAFARFAPGTDAIYSAQAYDCAILMALAAHHAGSTDGAAIRDAMAEVSGPDGTACETYAECKELLDAGESINYEGASGPIDFDGSDPSVATYDILLYDEQGTKTAIDQVVAS